MLIAYKNCFFADVGFSSTQMFNPAVLTNGFVFNSKSTFLWFKSRISRSCLNVICRCFHQFQDGGGDARRLCPLCHPRLLHTGIKWRCDRTPNNKSWNSAKCCVIFLCYPSADIQRTQYKWQEFPFVHIVNVKLATKSMTAIRGGENVSSNFKGGDLAVTMLKTDYTWICQNVADFKISPIL